MRIVVSGYYGCGNAGDEAVLAGMKEAFARQSDHGVELIALSQNPAETKLLHGLPSVNRMSLSEVRATLRNADLLISGGGSLLQDTTSLQSLLYYLWVMRMGFSTGVPVMMYAQGIGPLRRAMSRRLVRTVADRASAITVRDEPSANLLKKIGVMHPTIEVTADPAFALTPASRTAEAILASEGVPTNKLLIGLSLRPWGGTGESPLANYAKLIDLLTLQTGAQIVLISMHQPHDLEFARSVVEQTVNPALCSLLTGNYTPQELLALVGKMDTVVAMRLHALIFASRMTVPAFALSYDPKVESLMGLLGLEDCVESWRSFDPEETAERVIALLREKEARSASLAARLPDLQASALRNAECALSIGERRLDTLKTLISR